MTNPGDSDEWWKQYGGQGVSPDSGSQGSVPQQPSPDQPAYPSAPQYPQQPSYGQSQPQQPYPSQPQQSYPSQPQQSYPGYQQPAAQPYPAPPNYGYPNSYQPYGQRDSGSNGLAIAALIVSLTAPCSCVGLIVGPILGVMALNQIKERGGEGRGLAVASFWITAAWVVLGLLYLAFILLASSSSV